MTRKQRHGAYVDFPIEGTLDLIGGMWKGSIRYRLSEDTGRLNELPRHFPKIGERMLTSQRRERESDGLVGRNVYAQVPPKVEHSLTVRGRSLMQVLEVMLALGTAHVLNSDSAALWTETG